MQELKGLDGESLIISGDYLEKFRGMDSRGRQPLSRYEGTDVKTTTRRTKLFGGEKEGGHRASRQGRPVLLAAGRGLAARGGRRVRRRAGRR